MTPIELHDQLRRISSLEKEIGELELRRSETVAMCEQLSAENADLYAALLRLAKAKRIVWPEAFSEDE